MRQRVYRRPGAIAVEVSKNRKLGLCSATYAAESTCPTSCRFYGNGCYAKYGPLGRVWGSVTSSTGEIDPLEVAENEAECVKELTGLLDLRLHVAGDSRTRKGTRALASAALRHSRKHGRKVWTYTHAWRQVARSDWGSVSVLASCESLADVNRASKRGYAAALVVGEFEKPSAYALGDGHKLLPCPHQTRSVTCDSCRLCFDADRLFRSKIVIGFNPHGSGSGRVLKALEMAS